VAVDKVDFSRIARAYRWMEYFSFGPWLQRVRSRRLHQMAGCRRALVLGDGDGRFLAALLHANPQIHVDAVDISPGMVRLAQSRTHCDRIRWHQQDARSFTPCHEYDLIVSHFYLDCFSTQEVQAMVEQFQRSLAPNGLWINSDFCIPSGWAAVPGRLIVASLYVAFRWLTGLRTRELPDDSAAFASAGFTLADRETFLCGLLKSDVWRRHLKSGCSSGSMPI